MADKKVGCKLVSIVSVSKIVAGNTVRINGELKTVSNKDLKHCPFFGATLFGDSFRKGVEKITFKVPTAKGYRYC